MKTKLGNVTASSLKCVPIKWWNKPEYRPLNNLTKVLHYLLFLTDRNQFFKTYSIHGGFFFTPDFFIFSSTHVFFKVGGLEFDLLLNQNVKWETLECFLEEIYPWIFCFHKETNFLYKISITCILLSCSVGIFNVLCNTCTMYFFFLLRKKVTCTWWRVLCWK